MIASPVLPGEVLHGKYRVERVLGHGGMGVVVAARHVELDEPVAIKFLLGVPSEVGAQRFLAEARAAAKVKSEHVCRVFDFGRTPTGEPYIVMEHLEGHDLAKELAERGPLPPADVVRWAREACEGLGVVHALGIVHRDIKPENLFLTTTPGGRQKIKVLDFGVSKSPNSSVTRSAVAVGSPIYMSPEQLTSSRDVDARADVWSLGATLYELLSGEPPFHAENVFALAAMIRDEEARPLGQARPDLPPALCDVVTRCLAKRPAERFADALELGGALAEVAGPTTGGAVARVQEPGFARGAELSDTAAHPSTPLAQGRPASTVSSNQEGARRRQRLRAVGVGALVALAGVLAFGLSRARAPGPAFG
ncbi:MAG TPA: serine/threonine-protein kinase, partial [Polyangiaceae bacterium]|nr:serine/threonine-protein kinase [Polyangiaceae bacterium]